MPQLNNFLKRLITPKPIGSLLNNILYFIPRFVAGMMLTLDFGSSKFGVPWTSPEQGLSLFEVASWFPEDITKFGVPFSWAPWFFAWMGGFSEAVGGLFLALGLGTRFWAFLIACTMLTAIYFQKWADFLEQGFWAILPATGFLWVSIYCVIFGSGKLGIDYWLSKKFFRPIS